MSRLHIWAGLLAGWLLYAMFLTGTVSYFRDEISQWMRPELARQTQAPDAAVVSQRIVDAMTRLAPDSPQWGIDLPDDRKNVSSVFWRNTGKGGRAFASANLDPQTGGKLTLRDTAGGDFFYRFHFQFHYVPVLAGRWIAGLCAMFMLVAIISGIITHKKIFVDFFTFRWGKGQRSWLDAHNALSVLGLPFHLMITYSGLVTLMLMYMPWGLQAAFPSASPRAALAAETTAFVPVWKASGARAPLAPVADMVRQAQARWGAGNVGGLAVNHAGDAAARVIVMRGEAGRVSTSPQYMMFEGTSGKLLQVKDHVGAAAETRGVLYALHLGRYADAFTRVLYFLLSLAGTAMVGTGLVLWTVKRRQKLADPSRPHFGFRLVERLNIASIGGLSVAMTAFLWGNRLLPVQLPDRSAWEINLFFIVWAAMLFYACARPARKAWVEVLSLAAVLLALTPVLNAITTDRHLPASILAGDWVFAGFDLALIGFAALHAWLAIRTARHEPHAARRRPAGGRESPPRPRGHAQGRAGAGDAA